MVNQKHIYEEKLENSIFDQEQKIVYERLFQATDLQSFNYEEATKLLKEEKIDLNNNKEAEKKHKGISIILNIIRWAPTQEESIDLLKLICLLYKNGKQIIKNASYIQTSFIAIAVRNGKFKLADYLIDEIGIDVEQKDNQGRTPLFYLLQNKDITTARSKSLEYLLQRGVKIDVEDYKKNKLLDCVENEEIREKLLQARYNPSPSRVGDFLNRGLGKIFSFFKKSTDSAKLNIALTSNSKGNENDSPLLFKYQSLPQQDNNLKTNINNK